MIYDFRIADESFRYTAVHKMSFERPVIEIPNLTKLS